MLDAAPHPLSRLRAEVDAEAARLLARRDPVALLQAMIVAALALLLARIDRLVQLWAAGQLPALTQPSPRTPRRPRPRPTPAHRRPPAIRARRRRTATITAAGQGAPARILPPSRHPRAVPAAPRIPDRRADAAASTDRPASIGKFFSLPAAMPNCVLFVPL